MRLEGSLDAFSLPDIFALLSMTKKTGGLHLRHRDDRGVAWFRDGAIVGGSASPDGRDLARRLVASTPIPVHVLSEVVAESDRSGGATLVASLSERAGVGSERMAELVADHLEDVVFSLIRWTDGDFEFVVDEVVPEPAATPRSVDDLVTTVRQRLAEWERIGAGLPNRDAVLHPAGMIAADVTLTPEQWAMVALADGRRSVSELVTLSGRGEWAATRCLSDLLSAGVLSDAPDAGVDELVGRLATLGGVNPPPSPREPAVVDEWVPEPPSESDVDEQFVVETGAGQFESSESSYRHVGAAVSDTVALEQLRYDGAGGAVVAQLAEPTASAGLATVGALATVPDSEISPHERDPSINKSLLLRLIAGVRGL